MIDDRTSFTLSFLGTGTLPETMTIYVYAMWEGAETPDLSSLEGIAMTAVK